MKDHGIHQAASEQIRKGNHHWSVIEFMARNDGFTEDDWIVVSNRKI